VSAVSYAQLIRENRNFRIYWGGQIVSQLGDWFSVITVQALLLRYTGNASAVGGIIIAQMLPFFVLGPVAGVLVDRLPRKAVMVGTDLIRALVALGFLLVRGEDTVWIGYACVAGLSTFSAFFEPARIAILPNITTKEELVTANALSSVTWSILLTSGALVGGIVAHFLGTDVAFIANSVSFLASAALLSGLNLPPTVREGAPRGGFGEIAAGFAYVREHPQLMGALTAKLGWGLAGGIQSLLTIYGQRVFPLPNDPNGQMAIAILYSSGGLGTALGPVVARRFTGADPSRIRWAIAVSFVMGGVYYACMSGAPNLAITSLFLMLARFHGAIVWVFSTVLLQILARDQFRGRVFAAEGSLFTASMMLSNGIVTNALDRGVTTVSQATLVLGLISMVVGGVWLFNLRRGQVTAPAKGEADPEDEGGRAKAEG
jgi:MFS family permease